MKTQLSQKQIGQRITKLRKMKGLSQSELAMRINMSRPSLAQIELDNRGVNILELQQLSMALNFSLDYFMSENFGKNQEINQVNEEQATYATERIAVPNLKVDKFKHVLSYILEKCARKPNVGVTVLSKLLYFSDFNYYALYEEHLTGALYQKLPLGPVPQKMDTIN